MAGDSYHYVVAVMAYRPLCKFLVGSVGDLDGHLAQKTSENLAFSLSYHGFLADCLLLVL